MLLTVIHTPTPVAQTCTAAVCGGRGTTHSWHARHCFCRCYRRWRRQRSRRLPAPPPPPPPSALPYTHSPFVLLLLPPGLLPFCCCHDLCVKVCGFLM